MLIRNLLKLYLKGASSMNNINIGNSPPPNNQKFYQQNWFIYLCMFFFPPAGIALMWIYNKKSSTKFKGIITFVALIWFILMLNGKNPYTTNSDNTVSTDSEISNILLSKQVRTADVMNGLGDTVIGQRAYIEVTSGEMTSLTLEQFQEFANTVVKNFDGNYFSIIATDSQKAILFPASDITIIQYGNVNDNGMLDEVTGYILLQDDGSYTYEPKSEN